MGCTERKRAIAAEDNKKARSGAAHIAPLGMLTALEVVLSRFMSYSVWNMKIGISFVPVALAAVMYGPLAGAVVGGIGDMTGSLLFPIGAYFPGFTATAALRGAVFGWFLHRRQSFLRTLAAVSINQLVLGLCVNTLWVSLLYGSEYWPLFLTRIVQSAIMVPVELAVIMLMNRVLVGVLRKREI